MNNFQKIILILVLIGGSFFVGKELRSHYQEVMDEKMGNFMYHTLENCEIEYSFTMSGEEIGKGVSCNSSFVTEFFYHSK